MDVKSDLFGPAIATNSNANGTALDGLCLSIVELVHRFKVAFGVLAEQHGMTGMQLGVLHMISQGKSTAGHLAVKLGCDASNVTGIVDRLVQLGYVVRQENANDRRVRSLQLTEDGQRVLDGIMLAMPTALGCDRLDGHQQTCLQAIVTCLLRD